MEQVIIKKTIEEDPPVIQTPNDTFAINFMNYLTNRKTLCLCSCLCILIILFFFVYGPMSKQLTKSKSYYPVHSKSLFSSYPYDL